MLYRKYQYFETTTEWKRTSQKASGPEMSMWTWLIRIAQLCEWWIKYLDLPKLCFISNWTDVKGLFKVVWSDSRNHVQSQCSWSCSWASSRWKGVNVLIGFLLTVWMNGFKWVTFKWSTLCVQVQQILNYTKVVQHFTTLVTFDLWIILIVNTVGISKWTNKITWIGHFFWRSSATNLQEWA